jgi:hypothetical protein
MIADRRFHQKDQQGQHDRENHTKNNKHQGIDRDQSNLARTLDPHMIVSRPVSSTIQPWTKNPVFGHL